MIRFMTNIQFIQSMVIYKSRINWNILKKPKKK